MKIGILTFHRPANFGANLQAYSSYKYFASLGHEVKVINYLREVDLKYKNRVIQTQIDAHIRFVESQLPITKEVYSAEELQSLTKEENFDLIAIGADAVWRSPEDDCIFFAKWLFECPELADVPVISMSAAHMGNGFTNISEKKRKSIKDCLDRFSFISVRDAWTRDMINRDIYNGENKVKTINPDPVFMLDRFNDAVWDSKGHEAKGYYIMSLNANWNKGRNGNANLAWFKRFKAIVNEKGYKLVELPIPEGVSGMPFDYTVPYPIDPLQWYLWLKNAKAYCGLRFHAIVSCISAGTPFFSIDSYGTCNYTTIILQKLGLYKLATKGDNKSKIWNMLNGSKFEEYRIDSYINNFPAKRLFNMLETANVNDIKALRDNFIEKYTNNMQQMLRCIDNKK
ncbi:MAG: polysaccharide pyruvyl transferase family protein [Bacteroidaceae bacterium]|nr:polysaccharide pyruvyl transferase family protein [Bacteroidaceae bacterium]